MFGDIKWVSEPLYQSSTPINIAPNDTFTINLPRIKSDCKNLKLFYSYTLTPTYYLSKYNPQIFISLDLDYKVSGSIEQEFYHAIVNRDVFENIITLRGQDISNLSLKIQNKTSSTLTFSSFLLYESQDVSPTQIATVLKEETIQADLIHATSVFTDATFTQMLETNAMSRSVRIGHPGDLVDYIHIENNEIGFYGAVLGQEQEQFHIQTTTGGLITDHLYWYAMIEGEDAYKYLTTIDPRVKYPEISDSDRDKFKFMVYKPSSFGKKMAIEFAPDEKGNMTPSIIYGAGTDPTGQTNNGKGFTYKNSNGFYHIYQTSQGETVGIVMDENGVHITGWTDQHCEQIEFRDNGVHIKFTGEEGHNFEYVQDDSGKLTGILQDAAYLTTITYKSGVL